MPRRIEGSVFTRLPRPQAFEVMTDLRRWPEWTNTYQDVRWIEGENWAPGARREIQLGPPFAMIFQTTVISYEPVERVGWIDHIMAITLERWFEFHETAGGTRLDYWLEFTGVRDQDREVVKELIHRVVNPWVEAFRVRCEAIYEQSVGDTPAQAVHAHQV